MDSEAALSALEIRECLAHGNCLAVVAPKTLGCISLPCDQRFHSVVKRAYYRKLVKLPCVSRKTLDPIAKFELWREAFWSVDPEIIRGMFRSCGLSGSSQSPAVVAQRLLSEGHKFVEKFAPLHALQLEAYLQHRKHYRMGFDDLIAMQHLFLNGPFWDLIQKYIR